MSQGTASDTTHDWDAFTYEQRTQFTAAMREEQATIQQRIDELAESIDQSAGETRVAANQRLNELRNQATLLETRIGEVEGANASNWDSIKSNIRETYENLKDNFDDASEWMTARLNS